MAVSGSPAIPTLDEFEAVLARHDSATLALEEWCAVHAIADTGEIRARQVPAPNAGQPAELGQRLNLAPGETVAMRHVELACGPIVLSVAWNWYVPARLAPAMNQALERTDAPFGKVVAPLRFRRVALANIAGRGENCPVGTISTHRAMLVQPDGRPFAYLVECYTAANLLPSAR